MYYSSHVAPARLPRSAKQSLRAERARADAERLHAEVQADPAMRDLLEALRGIASWNSFAESLLQQHNGGRRWSDKQVASARGMLAKIAAKQAAREEAEAAPKPTVDLTPIRTMLDRAFAAGLKRPTFRFGEIIISRAPDTGRNPGALYVKGADGTYHGKLVNAEYLGNHGVMDALSTIAADPLGAAVTYGRTTGNCSCCGRKLTDPRSVAAAVGPICAERFGLAR
jgi:hypothetical protein